MTSRQTPQPPRRPPVPPSGNRTGPYRQQPKEPTRNAKNMAILAVILAAGVFLLILDKGTRRNARTNQPASTMEESVVILSESRAPEAGENAPTIFKENAAPPPQDEASLARQMSFFEAKSGLGIRSHPYFVESSGRRVLRVRIEAQARCGPGDYDAIQWDLERNKFRGLLVSLESIKPDGSPVVHDAKSISLASAAGGIILSLSVPEVTGPAPASIHVCTDTGPQNCTSKSAVAIESLLLARYNTPNAPGDGTGKLYYTNYVELGELGLGLSTDIDPRAEGFEEQFNDYGRKMAAMTKETPENAFKAYAQNGRILYSENLATEDAGVVVANLPRHEQSLCPQPQE